MPSILPYLPFPNDFIFNLPQQSSFSLSFAARPSFFSAKSLVRDSGVSIPLKRTLCL